MITSFSSGRLCGSVKIFERSSRIWENSLEIGRGGVELGGRCISVRGSV